jgi:hypothetical protein
MTPDDINKAIHEGMEAALKAQLPLAVQTAVDSAVNGKVNALRTEVAALRTEVSPMTNAYGKWLSARRNAFIAIGLLIAIGSFIQSVEAVWGIVTNYLFVGVR